MAQGNVGIVGQMVCVSAADADPVGAVPAVPAAGSVAVSFDGDNGLAVVVVVVALGCADVAMDIDINMVAIPVDVSIAPAVGVGFGGDNDPVGTVPEVPAAGAMSMACDVDEASAVPVVIAACAGADMGDDSRLSFADDPVSAVPSMTAVGAVVMTAGDDDDSRAVVIVIVTVGCADVAYGDGLVDGLGIVDRPLIFYADGDVFVTRQKSGQGRQHHDQYRSVHPIPSLFCASIVCGGGRKPHVLHGVSLI